MLIYVLIFVALGVIALLLSSGRILSHRFGLVLGFSLLIIVSGARGLSVGTDTSTYYEVFKNIQYAPSLEDAFSYSTISAPIYVIENWVVAKLTSSYQVILFINSAIIGIGFARFIYKTSPNVGLSIVLFYCLAFYFESMNGMRQYMAIALGINAYYCLVQVGMKSMRGWLLFLLSVGIHSTSIVLVPIALIGRWLLVSRGVKRNVMLLGVVSVAAVMVANPLLNVFLDLFPYYSMYDGTSNIDIFSNDYNGRIVLLYLLYALVVIFAFAKVEPLSADSSPQAQNLIALFPLVLFGVVIGLVFSKSFLMNRIAWYFIAAFVSFVPICLNMYKGHLKTLLWMVVGLGVGVWFIMQLIANQDECIPFVFWL